MSDTGHAVIRVIRHDRVAFTQQRNATQRLLSTIINHLRVCVLCMKHRKYVRSILTDTTAAQHNILSVHARYLLYMHIT